MKKATKRIIGFLLIFAMTLGSILPIHARAVPTETAGIPGQVLTAEFKYDGIVAINGTFSFSNPQMFSKVEVSSVGMSGLYNPANGQAAYYGMMPTDCTIIMKLTLASNAKVGDKCTITFEYESSADGKFSTVPDYKYDTVIVTVKKQVDYSALEAQIKRAEALKEKEYTSASWAKLKTALTAAQNARLSDDQSVVDSATKVLKDAIDALVKAPIDYSELRNQIRIAESLVESSYTAASWSKLQTALTAARAALNSNSQATVDKAASNLRAAIASLVRYVEIDYSELKRQIEIAEALIESEYTPESWAVMETALEQAKAALTSSSQTVVNNRANALADAIAALVRDIKIDYTELNKQIALASVLAQNQYTSSSWKVLANALIEARAATSSQSQDDVDAAAKALKDAIDGLVKLDFSALLAAIESVKEHAETSELADLWMQMHDLLDRANDLIANGGDQADIDQCTQDIIDLLAQIITEMDKLGKTEIVEVEKLVPTEPDDDYCNIFSHRIWPILFWISFALNVVIIGLIAAFFFLKKKKESDDTPLVDYDIEDDAEQ